MHRLAAVTLGSLLTAGVALAAANDVTDEVNKLLSSTNGGSGTVEGMPATFGMHASGRFHDQATTTLMVTIAAPQLQLLVHRPYDGDTRAKQIDVPTGDPGFDAAFVVEGAPSDLVKALLDEPLRQALMASDKTILDFDGRFVSVMRDGRVQTPEEVRRMFLVASLAARRLRDGLNPVTPLSDAARAEELSRLQATRSAQQRSAIIGLIPVFIIGALFLGSLVWRIRRRR
jgi:hypothetical protein